MHLFRPSAERKPSADSPATNRRVSGVVRRRTVLPSSSGSGLRSVSSTRMRHQAAEEEGQQQQRHRRHFLSPAMKMTTTMRRNWTASDWSAVRVWFGRPTDKDGPLPPSPRGTAAPRMRTAIGVRIQRFPPELPSPVRSSGLSTFSLQIIARWW